MTEGFGSGFGSGRPKNMDPADPDPDPQHWFLVINGLEEHTKYSGLGCFVPFTS
jgi:hypothetical protein